MTDKSIEISKVTKPKNPGRVAQGHKLAEYNRQRKQQILEKSEEHAQEQPQEQPSLPNTSTMILSVGLLSLLGYIVYDKIKPQKTDVIPDQKINVQPKPTKNPTDVFKMR